MNEASKTSRHRTQAFKEMYFDGTVLDIGCGPDLVVPHAEPFDLEQGDANEISRYLPAASYDCVHSSHCLEHMRDVPSALRQWWSLVKPGGAMIVVVPEENLYEQGVWPSIFNPDHKATFRLGGSSSWSRVSYDLQWLIESLPGARLISAEIQDAGYNYALKSSGPGPLGRLLIQLRYRTLETPLTWLRMKRLGLLKRLGLAPDLLDNFLARAGRHLGIPLDQTRGEALAQIQVVVRKAG